MQRVADYFYMVYANFVLQRGNMKKKIIKKKKKLFFWHGKDCFRYLKAAKKFLKKKNSCHTQKARILQQPLPSQTK